MIGPLPRRPAVAVLGLLALGAGPAPDVAADGSRAALGPAGGSPDRGPAVRRIEGGVDAREPSRPAPSGCAAGRDEFRTVIAVLARWADHRRRLDDVPGLALGLVCGTELAWTRGFGLADREARLPATDTTLFRIASISKVFTGLAVMQLRDAGRLALDDPVSEHLPWFRLRNSDTMPPVTVRHLLTHTSGLPSNSSATDFNRMTQPTASTAREALRTQRLLFPPGSEWKYSNLGFALLGRIVAAASGRPYARHLEERVLGPLGLRRSVAHPAPDAAQAAGYHLREPGKPRRRADFLHLAFFTPAGGMATTAEDLVAFVAYLLEPGRSRAPTASGPPRGEPTAAVPPREAPTAPGPPVSPPSGATPAATVSWRGSAGSSRSAAASP